MTTNTTVSQTAAEQLTFMPAVYDGSPVMPGGYYVTNNDRQFGHAARTVARNLPEVADGSIPVYMTIGNGGFESVSALLPPEALILHVDRDPRVLLTNRIARHAILESETRADFGGLLQEFAKTTHDAGFNGDVWHRGYHYQSERWSISGRFFPMLSKHFLATERSFRAARDSLKTRAFGYFAMDLFDSAHRKLLADRLGEANAQIVVANFTNVFDPHYNEGRSTPNEVMNDLPLHDNVLILQSSGRRYKSRIGRSAHVYFNDGDTVRVDRSAASIRY